MNNRGVSCLSVLMCVHVALMVAHLSTPSLIAEPLGAPPTQPIADGSPVTLSNASQFDFTSTINGQSYRLFVYRPATADPDTPLPVLYLFDGNWYFNTACDVMAMNELNGIVVGVGYPEVGPAVTARRSFDLSPPTANALDKKHGGGDAFLQVVDQEIKPFIAARYRVDASKQCLFGHSLGGLMVLRELFTHPDACQTYIAASPSIWWSSRALLKDEDAFTQRLNKGDLHLRLLITSAGDEQYHGTDPAQLEKVKANGMVDNASNLAKRLSAAIDPKTMPVMRVIFPGETHRSGSFSALSRALNFAFAPNKPPITDAPPATQKTAN